jgi:hypothetical protein
MKVLDIIVGNLVFGPFLLIPLFVIGAIRIIQAIRTQDGSLLAPTFESWGLRISLLALIAGSVASLSSSAPPGCEMSPGIVRNELSMLQLIRVALWLTISLGAVSTHSFLLRRIIGVEFQNATPKQRLLLHISRALLLTALTLGSFGIGWIMWAPRGYCSTWEH